MGINILQTIPPNVSIMKRLLFGILATLPLAYCMTGCSNDTDYGGFSYFIWANDSDHRITLSVAREYGELVIENEIIEPGESFEMTRARIMSVLWAGFLYLLQPKVQRLSIKSKSKYNN